MSQLSGQTSQLLGQLPTGGAPVRAELIRHACERLCRIASRMLRGFPVVRRWEETDDVLSGTLMRLNRALEQMTPPPESSRHFYNLAAEQIRRELLDLAARHSGPMGHAANHHTDGAGRAGDEAGGPVASCAAPAEEPASLEVWTHFHEEVARLPDELRQVFNLLWYHEMALQEAADHLGVSLSLLKRRWAAARQRLGKDLPG